MEEVDGDVGDDIIDIGDIVEIGEERRRAVVESIYNNDVYVRMEDGSESFWISKKYVRLVDARRT